MAFVYCFRFGGWFGFWTWLGFWFSEFWCLVLVAFGVVGFLLGLRLLWVAAMHVSVGFGGFPFGLGLPRSGFLLVGFVVVVWDSPVVV